MYVALLLLAKPITKAHYDRRRVAVAVAAKSQSVSKSFIHSGGGREEGGIK